MPYTKNLPTFKELWFSFPPGETARCRLKKSTLNFKEVLVDLGRFFFKTFGRLCLLIVQGIFAKIGPDLELRGGDLISSSVDSIVFLVSPKKSYGPNSVGKNYFSATPFSLLAKNATGGHNA